MHPNNLSEEQKEYYIEELVKHCDLLAHGVCVSNITAPKDVLWVMHEITREVCALTCTLLLFLTVF